MASKLASESYPQEDVLRVASLFVNAHGTAVDVGAHIGTVSVPLAKMAGKVVSFEPGAESFELLKKNAEANRVSVDARNVALGEENAHAQVVERISSNAGANSLKVGEGSVLVRRLDEEVTEADFVKIDAEGMELSVLKGAQKLLENSRPAIFLEFNLSALRVRKDSPAKIQRFFQSHGYKLYIPYEVKDSLVFGRVLSASLITAIIAPRSWLTRSKSAPFDVVALPQEKDIPVPVKNFSATLAHFLRNNIAIKMKRAFKYRSV